MQELDRLDGSAEPFSHRRKGKDGGLLHRLNTAETQLASVIALKNEVILRGFEDQQAVIVLTNQLAEKDASLRELRARLLETQSEVEVLRLQLTEQQSSTPEDPTFNEHLATVIAENTNLRGENADRHLEAIKLRLDVEQLRQKNLGLKAENADLSSSSKLLRSQVGSLHALYGPGLRYSIFRALGAIPLIGPALDRAAQAAYEDFRQRKNQDKSPKTR